MPAGISVVPLCPDHLERLTLQPAQSLHQPMLADAAYRRALAEPGCSWAGLVDGAVIGAAGIMPLHPGVGRAWALIGGLPTPLWLALTRAVDRVVSEALAGGLHRVETTVDRRFGAGLHWARLLGFRLEALMQGYGPDGTDHFLYARNSTWKGDRPWPRQH